MSLESNVEENVKVGHGSKNQQATIELSDNKRREKDEESN